MDNIYFLITHKFLYIKNNCKERLNLLHLFLSSLHALSFSSLSGYMFGLFGFGGFKGDIKNGVLLGRDNVSGYKRDGTSSSRHIDEKTGMVIEQPFGPGGLAFSSLHFFFKLLISSHIDGVVWT